MAMKKKLEDLFQGKKQIASSKAKPYTPPDPPQKEIPKEGYQSPYTEKIAQTLEEMLAKKDFSYDSSADPLYAQLEESYTKQGAKAMEDTLGKAAALTGGYGNSFAQTAAQQTYDSYLDQLHDRIPGLYDLALEKYKAEQDGLSKQLDTFRKLDQETYGQYLDQLSQNRWQAEFDRNQYEDDRDFAYEKDRDKVSDSQWQMEFNRDQYEDDRDFAYKKDRDKVSDNQWQQNHTFEMNQADTKKLNEIAAGLRSGKLSQYELQLAIQSMGLPHFQKQYIASLLGVRV